MSGTVRMLKATAKMNRMKEEMQLRVEMMEFDIKRVEDRMEYIETMATIHSHQWIERQMRKCQKWVEEKTRRMREYVEKQTKKIEKFFEKQKQIVEAFIEEQRKLMEENLQETIERKAKQIAALKTGVPMEEKTEEQVKKEQELQELLEYQEQLKKEEEEWEKEKMEYMKTYQTWTDTYNERRGTFQWDGKEGEDGTLQQALRRTKEQTGIGFREKDVVRRNKGNIRIEKYGIWDTLNTND